MEIWEPKPPGTLWAAPGLLRDCFTFTSTVSCFLLLGRLISIQSSEIILCVTRTVLSTIGLLFT